MSRCFPLVVALSVSGCAAEEPAEEVGRQAAALTPVTWTQAIGVSASPGELSKTAPETAFNAGAASVQTLAADGFLEFTTGENTTDKAAGLSNENSGRGLADIDFAIRLNASGRASVWEGGVNRGGIGPYQAGDVFRVQAEDGVVTYYRNGVLRYTSALAPSFPLLVDTSLRTPGATIQGVAIEPIDFWQNAIRVAVDGNDIVKTAPEDAFNAGASSIATIPSGDGYVEFRVEDTTTARGAGLGNGDSNTLRSDIEFAIWLGADGRVSVYESGVLQFTAFDDYREGDVFRVQVEGGVVSYLWNRVVIGTSSVAPTYPLRLDTSLRTPGAAILDARLVAGYVTPECVVPDEALPGPASFGVPDAEGDVLAVGYPSATPPVTQMWRRSVDGWQPEQTISQPPNPASETFARRVATDGETLALELGPFVAVYRFDGAAWVREDTLGPCASSLGLRQISVQGDLIVAHAASVSTPDRVYVFRRSAAGEWNMDGVLTGLVASEDLGTRVAVGGDRVFAGTLPGYVYVFRHDPALPDPPQPSCANLSPGKWQQEAILATESPHQLRGEIDANRSGTRLVAGDEDRDVHLFEIVDGVWSETEILNSYPFQFVGTYVDFGGPGPDEDSVIVTDAVETYVWEDLQNGWQQVSNLPGSGITAVSADSVFKTNGPDVDVFALEPLCLAE